MLTLVECPRDAMQGWKTIIPTPVKVRYLNTLLRVGFDTIDFGSFVSPRWIPQLADTKEVLAGLEMTGSRSKLLAIVANMRGAEDACSFEPITYLGYPLSVSKTFQKQNTNSTIEQSLVLLEQMQAHCLQTGKQLVVYLSMGFGNPYGDAYTEKQVLELAERVAALGIVTLSLADTVGLARPEQVFSLTSRLVTAMPGVQVGVHLHSRSENRLEKLQAALEAGCTRFDGALKGVGGCPMAGDELVGNMPTEWMIRYFQSVNMGTSIDEEALSESLRLAGGIFHS